MEPSSATPMSRTPPSALRKPATVLATACSSRSSRLPECLLYLADDLNSTAGRLARTHEVLDAPANLPPPGGQALHHEQHGRRPEHGGQAGQPRARTARCQPPTRLPRTAPSSPATTESDQLRRTRLRSSARPAAPRTQPTASAVTSTQVESLTEPTLPHAQPWRQHPTCEPRSRRRNSKGPNPKGTKPLRREGAMFRRRGGQHSNAVGGVSQLGPLEELVGQGGQQPRLVLRHAPPSLGDQTGEHVVAEQDDGLPLFLVVMRRDEKANMGHLRDAVERHAAAHR